MLEFSRVFATWQCQILEFSRVSATGEQAGERAGEQAEAGGRTGERAGEQASGQAFENLRKLEGNHPNLRKSTKNNEKMKERFDPQHAVGRAPNKNNDKTLGNNENPAKSSRKDGRSQLQEST